MAGRVLLEACKFLTASELLTAVALVSTSWKKAVYSDEVLLSLLENYAEDEAHLSLPLHRRLKKACKTVQLLHISNQQMTVWSLTLKSTSPVTFHNSAFVNSSRYVLISKWKAMVTGGVGQSTSCLQVYLRTGEVAPLQNLLREHAWHGIAVCRGVVYISGGDLSGHYASYAEKYEQGRWTEIANMIIQRYNHTLCAYSGQIYAFGGSNTEGYQNSIEYFNGSLWTTARMKLPFAQNYSSVLPVEGGLLLVGGFCPSSSERNIHFWKETTQQWRKICNIETDYSLSNAIARRHGVLYIFNHSPSRDSWPVALTNSALIVE